MDSSKVWYFVLSSLLITWLGIITVLLHDLDRYRDMNRATRLASQPTTYTVSTITETRIINGRHETTTKTIVQNHK